MRTSIRPIIDKTFHIRHVTNHCTIVALPWWWIEKKIIQSSEPLCSVTHHRYHYDRGDTVMGCLVTVLYLPQSETCWSYMPLLLARRIQ